MPKIITDLSVIEEEFPSEVFFSMLRNLRNGSAQPSNIRKDLNEAASNITDTLNKLIKAGIVNKPVIEGRTRLYSPSWEGLHNVSLKWYKEYSILMHLKECRGLKKAERPVEEKINSVFNNLKSSKFKDFLKDYFIEVSKKELTLPDTISTALEELEDCTLIVKNTETELKRTLKNWGDLVDKHNKVTDEAFEIALKKH